MWKWEKGTHDGFVTRGCLWKVNRIPAVVRLASAWAKRSPVSGLFVSYDGFNWQALCCRGCDQWALLPCVGSQLSCWSEGYTDRSLIQWFQRHKDFKMVDWQSHVVYKKNYFHVFRITNCGTLSARRSSSDLVLTEDDAGRSSITFNDLNTSVWFTG